MAAAIPKEPPGVGAFPQTVPYVLAARAADRPTAPAVSWLACDGAAATLSWHDYRERVLDTATGLLRMGLEPGGTVAVLAGNRVEHLIADLAACHCGAASVSLYPTFSAEQMAHVVGDAAPRVIIVEEAARGRIEQIPWVRDHRPHVITLPDAQSAEAASHPPREVPSTWPDFLALGVHHRQDSAAELERRSGLVEPDSPLTYIYTSGTTGLSKGVILTHRNLLWDAAALERTGSFRYEYRAVSSMPLAHVAERLCSIYLPLHLGGHVWCCRQANDLVDGLRRHRPSFFMAVPRVWEKLRQGVEAFLAAPMPEERRAALTSDRDVLTREWRLKREDAAVPAGLRAAAHRAREGELGVVRGMLGLDKASTLGSGAAPLREDVTEFFASVGMNIQEGYGLTETGGVAVADRDGLQVRGGVGLPLPGVELRIAADGEIELRGPCNTSGYRNLRDATAELYTDDGWLRTGDVGRLDSAGRLHITDRKKEILVNAAGKNIAPTGIESLIEGRGLIDQAMAVGEGRPYVVALLTVQPRALQAFAAGHGLHEQSVEVLLGHPVVRERVQALVSEANTRLSRPEQIKRFALLASPWSAESGELTPTLKKRRKVISERHRDRIDALYQRA